MARKIFVNLPVTDLETTKAFFAKLGFTFNAQFTNDDAASMVISDTIYAMLLKPEFFQQFTPRKIADAREVTEVLIALDYDSRAEVDALMEKALAAGASEPRPVQDHGFMYSRAFADLDGHIWEVFWMDPTAIESTE